MGQDIDVDRFCPNPTDDLYWNESVWFSFSIPERGVHGMVYYMVRPNMNKMMGGPILWDESGAHMWDCLYHDWHPLQPIPAGAQKFDLKTDTSLEVRVIEPRKAYRLGYDAHGFKLDITWTALDVPHHFLGMEIEAVGQTADNRMHFEQMGRAVGRAELHGEVFEFDSFALRDCSWGTRRIDGVKRGSYFWAIASEETAFHAQTTGDGDEQRVVGGFLRLNGKTASLVGGERVVTRMGRYAPESFTLALEDELGRTARITARPRSDLTFNAFPRVQVIWSLLEADFGDGVTGWGDIQEFQPLEMFRQMVRG